MIAIPDMDNGRLRHQDDSLNKYPKSIFLFHQLLKKFNVAAYICGHTHNASIAKINGVWQIDAGHARGIEALFPDMLIQEISARIDRDREAGIAKEASITTFYNENAYEVKKVLYNADLTAGISYKIIDDIQAMKIFFEFIKQYTTSDQTADEVRSNFWENANLARSTFLRVITGGEGIKIEIYRDDARGGTYTLMHSYYLN
jgi:hypothetical protein